MKSNDNDLKRNKAVDFDIPLLLERLHFAMTGPENIIYKKQETKTSLFLN